MSQAMKRQVLSKDSADQLSNGLYGWYAVCVSSTLVNDFLYFFSMYNEPLILYRDKYSRAVCIKDLCTHRAASFQGGEIKSGEIICPYHGAKFSSDKTSKDPDRICCNQIVDSTYNTYARNIQLHQYPCVEKDGYIYIYYTGNPSTNVHDIPIHSTLEELEFTPISYGFRTSEYVYEEALLDFRCDWSRIVENHLDILHIFWMHGNSLPGNVVNRKTIKSFNHKITKTSNYIKCTYTHKDNENTEFITQVFVPPGRIYMYRGSPETARYIQVLDHIPLANNRARVMVRHYRKFIKNSTLCKLILFSLRQRSIFYSIFSEDYLALKAQTFNEQMGYMTNKNMKLLAEDKAINWYWKWYESCLKNDSPWDRHKLSPNTNTLYDDSPMTYPPENLRLERLVNYRFKIRLILRILIFVGLLLFLYSIL